MRVVFMGTPEFAVPSLKILYNNGYDLPLVVTQPDRPKGRGRKMASPPVKKAALELGLRVVQAGTASEDGFLETIQKAEPDFLVVVAFGIILPKAFLDIPKIMPVNIHPSLLPKYRGPAPIQWALLNGEKETGVVTMRMDSGQDTGDVLLVRHAPISDTDTASTLHDRLALAGGELLLNTLERAAKGELEPKPQDHAQATLAPMLAKKDGRMDWSGSAAALERFIRAMDPWPGAFTFIKERRSKIFRAGVLQETTSAMPGTVISGTGKELLVATGKGVLEILELQGASGKRMKASDFLRGCPLPAGTCLE